MPPPFRTVCRPYDKLNKFYLKQYILTYFYLCFFGGDALQESINLVGLYDKWIEPIYSTQVGQVTVNLMGFFAILLACLMVIGLVFKRHGYFQGSLGKFVQDAKTIAFTCTVIIFLAGPSFFFPLALKLVQYLVNVFVWFWGKL